MRLRCNLIAYGCTLAFVASVGVVFYVNFQPNPESQHREIGLIATLWIAAFFLPPFFVGSRASEYGAIYGLVVGLVPLVIALLIGYSVPLFFAAFFYAFAPLGGFLGQRLSRSRSAG